MELFSGKICIFLFLIYFILQWRRDCQKSRQWRDPMENDQKNRCVKLLYEWNPFLANLDIKVVRAGIAENFHRWPFRQGLTEDIYYRLYLAVSGSFRLEYSKGSCVIEPGNLYLIPCDTLLKYEGIVPCTHYWIHFISDHLKTIPILNAPIRIPLQDAEAVQKKMQMILKRMENCSDFGSAVFIRNSTLELLIPFLKELSRRLPDAGSYEEYAKILNYIDSNLHRDFTISELNAFSKLNSADFSASFRRIFGLPPKQYVSMRRMDRAKHMLLETALPIKEIARRCGYQDEYFFHRIFKKYTGNPPARYRKYSIY